MDAGEIFITAEQSETEPVQPPSEQNMLMEEKPSSQQKVEPVHVEPVKAEKKDDGPNVKQLVEREVQQSPKETVSKPNREKPSSQPAAKPSKPKEDPAPDKTEPETPPVQPQPDKDEVNKQIVGKFQEINQNQLKTGDGQLIASNENQKVIIRNADKTIVYSSSFQWKQDDVVLLVGWNGNNSFTYEVASGNLTQKFVIQIQDKVEQPVNS